MYIVTINNDGVKKEIHSLEQKLASGSIVKGINAIDTFSFSISPSNDCFGSLNPFKTLIDVFNTNRNRYEFHGRILHVNPSMSDNGLIKKDVTCENYFGFLCDSQQRYVDTRNWTVVGLLQHMIDVHNSQVEEYKHFKIGEVNVTDPNNNLYIGIQRMNTWDALNEKLVGRLGGEFRFRVEDDGIYLDYLVEIGELKQTAIELSRNMKSITQEHDPTAYVTRLIPLGESIGEFIEERLDITSVNDGKDYIDDEEAIAAYGLHVGYKQWDDVTDASNLLRKGREWLKANNRVLCKYSITALDLSLIGLDIDDFDVGNKYPIKNPLLGIDDVSRIVKETINICDETKSTIEVGDTFKNLTDIQIEKAKQIESSTELIGQLQKSSGSLGSRVASAEETLETIDTRIADAEIAVNKNAANIALKASLLDLDDVRLRMSYAGIEIDGAAANVKLLAKQTTVEGIDTRLKEAKIEIDGLNSEIELKADKITLNGYVTASTFNAEIAAINNIFAGYSQAQNLHVNGSLTAQTVQFTNVNLMAYDCEWNDKTVMASLPEFTTTNITLASGSQVKVVTGWATAPSQHRTTLNYITKKITGG